MPPAAFAQELRSASPGDIAMTSFEKLDGVLPPLPLAITPSGDAATLVFSDRPEYFREGDGISCQETVQPGRVRFYVYHVPVPLERKPRRVIARFENVGNAPATVRFNSHSEPKIGGDYNAIAKEAMVALLSDAGEGDVLKLPPGGHDVSDRAADVTDKSDLLVHALYDFTTDQPLRLTVAQIAATDNLENDVADIDKLAKLPMAYKGRTDSAGRGSFPNADRDVALANAKSYDTADGPAQILIADGNRDAWIEGVDGITGAKTLNKGNYGVVYHLKLKFKSTDGRGVALLMTSARFDSKWCGTVAAAVKVNDGKHPGGVINLPAKTMRFHGIPEACVIQTYDAPANGAEGTIELDYTPPGACCLPTPILLVPIDK